jgi:predicted RNase H-like HicB family nuclease
MKYKIVVEKLEDNKFFAYCPGVHVLKGLGPDMSSAMHQLKENMICHLHDPLMELEIVMHKAEIRSLPVNWLDIMERK